ncbi:cyb5r2 [Symbiodinium pilosum]|uniref:Cyb5r2 protein n=1 Tax=Symbiodinium pilosum TaxID=2952 RepID=A0A812L8L0_SYMPI|nr:cyb5r2 [Symbiodinium pilosum]
MKITQAELSEHNTTSSLWISIGGIVCDVTEFLMLHPGGNDILLQHGGTEAYEAFEEVGHSDFARKMVHEKAIGLLVDGREAPRAGQGVSLLGRLFTKEDNYNIHKTLGIFILCHTFYRIYTACDMQLDGGFTSEVSSLALCWVSMLLQVSSFLFEVPRARLLGSPMIWQEWRAHNLVFVGRHVLAFTICWVYIRYVNISDDFATFFVDMLLFAVLYAQLYSVDVITAYIREDKHTSLTASWPFWDGCPIWLEKSIKWYYTIAQFQASSLLVMTGSSLFDKYMVIFPFQFASFLMTLVRKGIITTKGFHAGYLWSLFMVVWLILGPQNFLVSVVSFATWIILYIWRSYGLSKYALWLGPLLSKMLAYYHITPDNPLVQLGTMMITWIVCMVLQKCVMGFATEVRARRFLEARQKPMKLVDKETISDNFVLLKFEVPAGYAAGINPGQHVKVHVPNPSKGRKEWNKHANLEEPVEILSRSYTPVSATTSPTLDLMVRHYHKSPERGFPDGGRASTYLVEKLKVGSKILMSGPHGHQLYFGQGNFLVGKNMVKARVCGALAGGSGITPVLATLRDIWQEGRRDVRDRDQRILGEQAVKMKEFAIMHVTRSASEALPQQWYQPPTGCGEQTPIRMSHVITGSDSAKAEVPGALCYTGRVTEEMVKAAMPPPGEDVVIFVCGPQGFSEACCRPILKHLGYKHVVMLQ